MGPAHLLASGARRLGPCPILVQQHASKRLGWARRSELAVTCFSGNENYSVFVMHVC